MRSLDDPSVGLRTSHSNLIIVVLTNAVSGSRSERVIGKRLDAVLVLVAEPVRIELVGVGVEPCVTVYPHNGDYEDMIFLDDKVLFLGLFRRHHVVLAAHSVDLESRRPHP